MSNFPDALGVLRRTKSLEEARSLEGIMLSPFGLSFRCRRRYSGVGELERCIVLKIRW